MRILAVALAWCCGCYGTVQLGSPALLARGDGGGSGGGGGGGGAGVGASAQVNVGAWDESDGSERLSGGWGLALGLEKVADDPHALYVGVSGRGELRVIGEHSSTGLSLTASAFLGLGGSDPLGSLYFGAGLAARSDSGGFQSIT